MVDSPLALSGVLRVKTRSAASATTGSSAPQSPDDPLALQRIYAVCSGSEPSLRSMHLSRPTTRHKGVYSGGSLAAKPQTYVRARCIGPARHALTSEGRCPWVACK